MIGPPVLAGSDDKGRQSEEYDFDEIAACCATRRCSTTALPKGSSSATSSLDVPPTNRDGGSLVQGKFPKRRRPQGNPKSTQVGHSPTAYLKSGTGAHRAAGGQLAALIANAILLALGWSEREWKHTGARIRRLPMKPETVFWALQDEHATK